MSAAARNIAHPLAALLCAALLIFCADALAGALSFSDIQTNLLRAVIIGVIVMLNPIGFEFAKRAPAAENDGESLSSQTAPSMPPATSALRYPTAAVAPVLAAGAIVGLVGLSFSFASSYFGMEHIDVSSLFGKDNPLGTFTRITPPEFAGIPVPQLLMNLLGGILTCLLVAVWEEGLFRGLLISCIVDGLPLKNPRRVAAVASAVVFGLLHVSLSPNFSYALQGVLKGVEAALFGYCLAMLILNTGSLLQCIAVHALFDFMYYAPTVLSSGRLTEGWIAGTPFATFEMIAAIVLLIVAAAIGTRQLRI